MKRSSRVATNRYCSTEIPLKGYVEQQEWTGKLPGRRRPEGRDAMTLSGKRILLIISGGIAAYKSLDLIRRLRERGASVRPVMTAGAQQFVTPLAVGALAASHVYLDLFSREDEQDVGHIRLARECDLIVVAPATADLMAKMANGHADDLASTILLASDRPVLVAPAMNPKMWANAATRRNRATLAADGIRFIGPEAGEMAESGEAGEGRMSEPLTIVAAVETLLSDGVKPLAGRTAIVTSGPTHEPIDPVRYIANRSSGKQGHAIAAALARLGADVTLVSGPVTIPDPSGVKVIHVERAEEMRDAVLSALPADIAVMVAAVADWRGAGAAGNEETRRGAAAAAACRKPGYPQDRRPPRRQAEARGRLCRRDGECCRQWPLQARAQGRRLYPRQRRLAGNRHHGRRPQPGEAHLGHRQRRLARHGQGRRRRQAGGADRGRTGAERAGLIHPLR